MLKKVHQKIGNRYIKGLYILYVKKTVELTSKRKHKIQFFNLFTKRKRPCFTYPKDLKKLEK